MLEVYINEKKAYIYKDLESAINFYNPALVDKDDSSYPMSIPLTSNYHIFFPFFPFHF